MCSDTDTLRIRRVCLSQTQSWFLVFLLWANSALLWQHAMLLYYAIHLPQHINYISVSLSSPPPFSHSPSPPPTAAISSSDWTVVAVQNIIMIYAICKSIVNSQANLLLCWFFGQNRQINCAGVGWEGVAGEGGQRGCVVVAAEADYYNIL